MLGCRPRLRALDAEGAAVNLFKIASALWAVNAFAFWATAVLTTAFLHNDDRHAIVAAIAAINVTVSFIWARWEWTRKP